ncbi:hypothetical protein CH92_13010 [Stutzerimonas stutzeri]|uniref:Uncharacterized protein n=1 Tax=Stutzerimonas stutzeri TaxID=316 RepID=W8RV62_STUST|nr:hypothetical protein [Stutzerimonas stutzeri]AHL75961.1 hypothetical protein CH92_13010 [Stutzerimonas stutzeri]MCQ4330687.1 hypothetical protein [Stutzerimonas stutzeri]
MSLPLSSSSDLAMRKDLVRLRMEMNRQQLLYHSQPLAHPFQRIKGMVASRGNSSDHHIRKGPLMIATTLALTLFGRRLGKVGKLARLGIMLYPVVRKLRH